MQKNTRNSYCITLLKYLSNRFLSSQSDQNISTAILFVDIVKSTNLTTTLTPDEMSSLIRVFSQEISILISKHSGFVLKYAGDAAIAYFPISHNAEKICQNVIRCAKSMNLLIKHAINPVFEKFDLPEIKIRVGRNLEITR
ncbi:MAG: adenylate/guanylate cyclase domain-containing protein [Nitrosopumilus sp.]|nr:adenylate/guanylate cyclase domain-containing protein [Nitrosopumilus sp.]